MKKKVIIFDMDGVLFDSIPFARRFFLKGHPGMTDEMYNEMHCENFHEAVKKVAHLGKEENEEQKKERHEFYSGEKSKTPMFEGIGELLKDLHNKGYLLILNTNAYDRNCLPLLDRSLIKDLFDIIATAEFSKSKVEKFKLIEEKYKISKGEVLFITDSLGDVREADVANINTIAVTWGVHDAKFFEREKHSNLISIVNTVEELKNSIEKYF